MPMDGGFAPYEDRELSQLRVPPHSIEAESSVLGGLLLDNNAWDRVGDLLVETDFYRHDHQLIYACIGKLINDNKPADVITVYERLQSSNKGEEVGGLVYINSLAQYVPSSSNIRRYAEIVRERSLLRKLLHASNDIATNAANTQGRAVEKILDEAQQKIFNIGEEGSRMKQGFQSMENLSVTLMDRIQEMADNPNDITGVPTGFIDLDKMTSGLQAGDMVVLAARPSMGKAQPLDAQVRTRTGWKAMGQLEVGDALASVDGQASVVTGIFPQGVRPVYRLSFSDGRSAEACAEHLWRVHCRHWPAAKVLSTAEMMALLEKKRYQGRLWIDTANGDFGHHDPLPIDPWVLGAWLGAQGGAQPNPLRVELERLRLSGLASDAKFIPRLYLEAQRAVRLDLLRGLLDTDGWVERWGSVRFSTASHQLALDLAELVRSLGGWCSISSKTPHYRNSHGLRVPGLPAYICHIAHPQPQALFLLPEKQARLPLERQRAKRLTISSITPSREAPCQCIAVSHPERLYITNDDVVTHNTAFAINIAENAALHENLPVAIFSMEMSAAQLAVRIVGSMARVDQSHLRNGRVTPEEWPRLTEAIERLRTMGLYIDETPGLTPSELRANARRLARQLGGKMGLVVVDYLQLMSGSSGGHGENRATELGEISRGLKMLAKELGCPVIALSQLNRSVETRTDKRPMMSDLRESGAIEQDADIILFIYRDDYYNKDSKDQNIAEIIIGKQRNGPTGTVKLYFHKNQTRFESLALGSGDSEGYDNY
ncbi:MAG: replicative DNA helicase [Giesbergeria sp.]|uniref:replicative DNA helicase n=1 Tax=Giesbergeria sp. TaxID=2818473 RepID=UPI002605D8C3|nr:replicative DNA helicase [Giesbergeria sp.]MDD2609201.1 replicative DNA helicase [Giesbergeria sp.]